MFPIVSSSTCLPGSLRVDELRKRDITRALLFESLKLILAQHHVAIIAFVSALHIFRLHDLIADSQAAGHGLARVHVE